MPRVQKKPEDLPSHPRSCNDRKGEGQEADRKSITKLRESKEGPRQLFLIKLKEPKMSMKVD